MTDTSNPFVEDNSSSQQIEAQNTQETPDPSNDNPFADQLKKIVNDKGEPKYKDVAQALEALAHAQQFIETLKSEKSELENKYSQTASELEKRAAVEEVLERLTGNRPNTTATKEDLPMESALDENKIKEMVLAALNEQSQQTTAQQNFAKVSQALTQTYGEKVREVIQNRAKELGTTTKDLEELSKTKPNLVLSLFQDVKVQNTQPSVSTQYTPRIQNEKLEPPKPSRSLMRGATNKEVLEALRASKEYTNKRLGVQT